MKLSVIPAPLTALFFLVLSTGSAQEKKNPPKSKDVFTIAAEAGPDFAIQGEYEGELSGKKIGVQIVALGSDKFDVYFLAGGLPGAGWDTKTRTKVSAKLDGEKATLTEKDWSGEIASGAIKGKNPDGGEFTLKKVERKSKTLGEKAPEGAMILFDGKSADEWKGGKIVEENLLNNGINSVKSIGTGKLHIEFRTPYQPKARGQGRGNSGVFIQGTEIQVLDSFGLKGENNECGGFYSKQAPAVNMCFPPLSWQTYDVELKELDGNVVATVYHNGVLIHENYVIKKGPIQPAGIQLQNHGNPVYYRNIWFVAALPTALRQDLEDQLTSKTLPTLKMKLIKAKDKTFLMGSPKEEVGRESYEFRYKVTLRADFYLGVYTVTQAQYEKVMGRNPSKFVKSNGGSGDHPVEQVSWYDAVEFCNKSGALDGRTAAYELSDIERNGDQSIKKASVKVLDNSTGYRLPTEEQWEYACRAGSTTRFFFGEDDTKLGEYAWYSKNSESKTHGVGEKKPNAWGLYDMQGNVSQWCENFFTSSTSYRVNRGDNWLGFAPQFFRSAARDFDLPSDRGSYLGFRLLVPVR